MASVSDKIKNIVNFLTSPFESGRDDGFIDEIENGYGDDYPMDRNAALDPFYGKPATSPMRAQSNVIKLPNRGVETSYRGDYEIVSFEPRAYEESIQIAQALKDCKTVILNLQLLDREESQRIVDFLCGCTHALDGNQKKIGDFVFIFTPKNINLTQEMVSSKLANDALWNAPLPQTN